MANDRRGGLASPKFDPQKLGYEFLLSNCQLGFSDDSPMKIEGVSGMTLYYECGDDNVVEPKVDVFSSYVWQCRWRKQIEQ